MFADIDPPRQGATGGRRSPIDIFASILEVTKRYGGEGRVTRISYGAGMPVDRVRTCLRRLSDLGLARATRGEEGTTYAITARGQEFLDTYWRMRSFVGLLDPSSERRGRTREGPPPDPR